MDCGDRSAAGSPTSSALLAVAAPTLVLLLPQFVGVLQQAEIIVGHAFVTHEGKKKALFDAVVQHTRHLNDYPIQNALIALAAIGFVILLVRRIWWPAAVWLVLVLSIVHSSAPFGGPLGKLTGTVQRPVLQRPAPAVRRGDDAAGPDGGHRTVHHASAALAGLRRLAPRLRPAHPATLTAAVLSSRWPSAWPGITSRGTSYLIGEKYDQVIIDDGDLAGIRLPGHPARRPRHRDRRRQHRRHGVDVRRRRTPPAVDALRLPPAAGPRATTASSSGRTPTTPTPIPASPRPSTR